MKHRPTQGATNADEGKEGLKQLMLINNRIEDVTPVAEMTWLEKLAVAPPKWRPPGGRWTGTFGGWVR